MIEELEDLRVEALERLSKNGKVVLQEEDVVSEACEEISKASLILAQCFRRRSIHQVDVNAHGLMKRILAWTTILTWVFDTNCPLESELQIEDEPWQPEVRHCGSTTAMMINSKASQIFLGFFLSDQGSDGVDADGTMTGDIFSLIDLMAIRVGSTFKEVLNSEYTLVV